MYIPESAFCESKLESIRSNSPSGLIADSLGGTPRLVSGLNAQKGGV